MNKTGLSESELLVYINNGIKFLQDNEEGSQLYNAAMKRLEELCGELFEYRKAR